MQYRNQEAVRGRPRGALSPHRLYFMAALKALRSHRIEPEEEEVLEWLRRRLRLSRGVSVGLRRRAQERCWRRGPLASQRLDDETLLLTALRYAGTKPRLEASDETLLDELRARADRVSETRSGILSADEIEVDCGILDASHVLEVASGEGGVRTGWRALRARLEAGLQGRGWIAAAGLGFAMGVLIA